MTFRRNVIFFFFFFFFNYNSSIHPLGLRNFIYDILYSMIIDRSVVVERKYRYKSDEFNDEKNEVYIKKKKNYKGFQVMG